MAIHITERPILEKAIAVLKQAKSLGVIVDSDLEGTAAQTKAAAATRISKIHICDRPAAAPLLSAILYANTVVPAQFLNEVQPDFGVDPPTVPAMIAALQAA